MRNLALLTVLLIAILLAGVVVANQKRLMCLNHVDFDLSAGDRVKVTAQFTNLTNKPLGQVFLSVKCLNGVGQDVIGNDHQITLPGQKIAPHVPGTYTLNAVGDFDATTIKACSCTVSIEKNGRRFDQDTYSVQIK
jgi:hypothetical protein